MFIPCNLSFLLHKCVMETLGFFFSYPQFLKYVISRMSSALLSPLLVLCIICPHTESAVCCASCYLLIFCITLKFSSSVLDPVAVKYTRKKATEGKELFLIGMCRSTLAIEMYFLFWAAVLQTAQNRQLCLSFLP